MLTGILDNRDDLRVAVVVNDVASVNVDGAVIRKELVGVDETEVELLELQNGCVCCGPGAGSLTPAVAALAAKTNEATGEPSFDHVVVELSGVADPTAIADMATLHPDLSRDLVVVLCDVTSVRARAADTRLADTLQRQLASADLVIANHSDRATDDELRESLAWLGMALWPGSMCHRQAKPPAVLVPQEVKAILPRPILIRKKQAVRWTSTAVGSLGCRQDICCVSRQDICCVSSQESCNI